MPDRWWEAFGDPDAVLALEPVLLYFGYDGSDQLGGVGGGISSGVITVMVAAVVVAIAVMALVARRVLGPVTSLTAAVRRMEQGDLSERVEVGGADELAQLGSAFNDMADAIEMNEESVRGSGLDTNKLKLFAFMVSAAVAGIGGAFYFLYPGSIAPPALFDIHFLFTIIVSALLGGASTIIGPMLGAFFLTFLLEYLRPVLPGAERYFVYGMIALVLYVYRPAGLYSVFWEGVDRLRGTRTRVAAHA